MLETIYRTTHGCNSEDLNNQMEHCFLELPYRGSHRVTLNPNIVLWQSVTHALATLYTP